MKLIKNIVKTKYAISRIKMMFDANTLFVDDSFQRRYVWEEKHKVALIETILLGYDIPMIYLWQQEPNPQTGEICYSIVDGQQRLGAIYDFINNQYPLKRKYLLDKKESEAWGNLYFTDLPDEQKRNIWTYDLDVAEIDRSVSIEHIKTLFYRLNYTNKSLNPQELRNAQFDGKFIKLAILLSENEFWTNNRVFSINDVRRMKDVEFVSYLLIFLRKGMKTATNSKTINRMYDLYNDKYEEYEADKEVFIQMLHFLQIVLDMSGSDYKSKLSKTTHIYTLFVVCYAISIENFFNADFKTIASIICDFYKQYFDNNIHDENVMQYMKYTKDAVASIESRTKRYSNLIDYIRKKLQ